MMVHPLALQLRKCPTRTERRMTPWVSVAGAEEAASRV